MEPWMTNELLARQQQAGNLANLNIPSNVNPIVAALAGLARGYGGAQQVQTAQAQDAAKQAYLDKIVTAMSGSGNAAAAGQALMPISPDLGMQMTMQGWNEQATAQQRAQQAQLEQQKMMQLQQYHQQQLDQQMKLAQMKAANPSGGSSVSMSGDMQLLNAIGGAMAKQARGEPLTEQDMVFLTAGQQMLSYKSGALNRGEQVPGAGISAMPTPGGKIDTAKQEQAAKASMAAESAGQKAKQMATSISEIKALLPKNPQGGFSRGGGFAGLGRAGTALIPASNMSKIKALLMPIQANASFDTLQAMRQASPTGAALGAISDKEIGLLMNTIAALDPINLEPDQFAAQLDKILPYFEDLANRLQAQTQAAPAPVTPAAMPAASPFDKFRR